MRLIDDEMPTIEPKQADDLISRADAIEAVERAVTKEVARWSIKELPFAQPKQGEWVRLYDNIWICNNCEQTEQFGENIESTSNYCPNCGARMTERSE